jgi:uncharacterized protein YdeI (YjbR/CyaY-like superfamily)
MDLPTLAFEDRKAWEAWLKANHTKSEGLWLEIAKVSSGSHSVTYPEALDVALCYGWIDGQKRGGEHAWLQKFTPRRKQSIWSKINCEKALALIESKRMKPAGLREIERAKADGRWDRAYDGQRTSVVSDEFQKALDASPQAKQFFDSLPSGHKYSFLFRIQTAKKAETRARKVVEFIVMLERRQTIHPLVKAAKSAS